MLKVPLIYYTNPLCHWDFSTRWVEKESEIRLFFDLALCLIALSHIHVSAAYRSRIYENFDTPRSEPYFSRATYVPRTCDVPATFQWRIYDVSVVV